jgi:hypothetical protein
MERSASKRVMVRRGRSARTARTARTAAAPDADPALEPAGMKVVKPASTIKKSNTFQGPLWGSRGRLAVMRYGKEGARWLQTRPCSHPCPQTAAHPPEVLDWAARGGHHQSHLHREQHADGHVWGEKGEEKGAWAGLAGQGSAGDVGSAPAAELAAAPSPLPLAPNTQSQAHQCP